MRDVVVALRTPTHRNKLIQRNLRQPVLNNLTRWNSTFNIKRLVEFKEYCTQNEHTCTALKVSVENWEFAEEFLKVFAPVKAATVKLQSEQLPLGDFYKIWLELRLTLQNMSEPMAVLIKNAIKQRETNLLNNNTLHYIWTLDFIALLI